MPLFPGIGSGDSNQIADQTRALKAYESARRRLLSTIKGEEQGLAKLAAAHSAASSARMRDSSAYDRELQRTSSLLSAQGEALKNLDSVRERYHREEMTRSRSLLQEYERYKLALREIREDSDDTKTILGSFVHPFKAGIDQMLRFGHLPQVTRPIRDTAISFDDITGSVERSAGAAEDLGHAMVEVFPSAWRYRNALESLNVELTSLKVKYADATEGTQKLAQQFISAGKIDIGLEGSVETVTSVTDSLKYLEAQGIATDTAMSLLVDRTRKSGQAFEESAHDVEVVAAQSDILRASLEATDTVLEGFAFTVRDDFVRAIADATRNLDSQVVSIENVSAAYVYASEMAAKYGLSASGAEKVSRAFSGMFFKERGDDAAAYLSGDILQDQLRAQLASILGEGETFSGATKDRQREILEQAYGAMGVKVTDENVAALTHTVGTLDDGLGAVDMRNLLAGTTAAIKADLDAMMSSRGIGLGGIKDASVASRLLSDLGGWGDLSTEQKLTLTKILQEEGSGAVADRLLEIQEQAESKATDMKDLQSSALTTVLSLKDPIQQLFNIKDFLKSIMLNVSNIVKLVSSIPGLGGVRGLYTDITGEALGSEVRSAAVDETLESLSADRNRLLEDYSSAVTKFAGADEGERSGTQQELERVLKAIQDNQEQIGELESLRSQYDSLQGSDQESPDTSTSYLDSLRSLLPVSSLSSFLPSFGGEQGRDAGVAMAQRVVQEISSRPDVRSAYARSSTRPVTAQQGEMEADGAGEVTVDANGDSIMTVRMRIRNMSEVVAHHTSIERRTYDALGLTG